MLLRINGNPYPISSPFGSVDSVHLTPHTGVDIAVPEGTPLYAIEDSVVTKVDTTGTHNIGEMVRMEHADGTDVIYGHMSQINVNVGDHVHAGELVGLSGNTGHSTGPHVHLQMVADNGALIDPTAAVSLVTDPTRGGGGILDRLNDFADWFIGKETDIIAGPVTHTLSGTLHHIVALLNTCSAEIITLGIVVCAVGMMVGPIVGAGNKWLGRLFVTFWGGVIWRALT